MGRYKYEIYSVGYANEIVVGTLEEEMLEKIELACEQHDMSVSELFEDFELLSEYEIPEWHELDNKEHVYGPSMDGGALIVVNTETNQEVLEKDFFDLESFELEEHHYELRTHQYEDKPLFHYATVEKGVAMHGYLDLDEPFNESKLNFKVVNLEIDEYEYEIVRELYYDNEPIETEINSTDYKDFVIDIIEE